MSKVLTIFCMQQKSGKFLDRLQQILRRVLSKFFEQVGHETMYASSGDKHFSLILVVVRLTKIMNRADKKLGTILGNIVS